ncbi:hypothetical protein [Thomasclavelia ramosa]|uniref:hypothetical protein n=1 Tax=Thomasclavelia ramosa TaxID=1547 RepID=UPI0022DF2C23|nr:hypothetical protein [Thomasclavelia ramosa]
MLKIEKIKEEILNFNHANALRCYLARVTTKQSNIDGCCRPNLRCEECLKVSFIDLLEEYKKPVKLTKFEYEYLKVAKENEYNFIARDKNGTLVIYNIAPHKTDTLWCTASAKWDKVNFNNLFNFVKFEDEDPWNIDNILANCEVIENE